MENANSAEFENEVPYTLDYPVIDLMPEQEDIDDLGGTMRLGAYPCKVMKETRAFAAYDEPIIYERHRHRYEVNNMFRERLVEAGLVISGISPDARLVEMIELPSHPWFVASQGHPEFKSRPTRPHPLFRELVGAAIVLRDEREGRDGRDGRGESGELGGRGERGEPGESSEPGESNEPGEHGA
jgi:CTP synthase